MVCASRRLDLRSGRSDPSRLLLPFVVSIVRPFRLPPPIPWPGRATFGFIREDDGGSAKRLGATCRAWREPPWRGNPANEERHGERSATSMRTRMALAARRQMVGRRCCGQACGRSTESRYCRHRSYGRGPFGKSSQYAFMTSWPSALKFRMTFAVTAGILQYHTRAAAVHVWVGGFAVSDITANS
jgi:hypothetical protein